MSTDQAPARDVDDVLASIDDVLAATSAPAAAPAATVPAPAPAPAAAVEPPTASPQVKATPTAPTAPTYPPTVPAPAAPSKGSEGQWWSNIFEDDQAWKDTNSGAPRGPKAAVPAPPSYAPTVPATPPAAAAPKPISVTKNANDEDPADEAEDEKKDEEPEEPGAVALIRQAGRQVLFAPRIEKGEDGPTLTYRGRKVLFAASAAGLGWYVGLYGWSVRQLDLVAQHTDEATAFVFGLGVISLAARSKVGCAICAVSTGVAVAIQIAPWSPVYLVGGAAAAGLHSMYRAFRHNLGEHGRKWPWAAAAWLAHVPAATFTLAVLTHGAN